VTVAQLIERLQKMPQDLKVFIEIREPYDDDAKMLREEAQLVRRTGNDFQEVVIR
jgi:hypothetical protein